jgi:hypothetical protein
MKHIFPFTSPAFVRGLLLSCTLAVVTGHAQVQQPSGKSAVLKIKQTTDFELTGDGSAAAWKTTQWFALTKRRGTPDYPTQAKLLYSETGIYGVISCADKKITATLKEDFADLYKEDVVEIFFWTDESMPLYFEYELSPLNYELAILVPNFKGDFFGWTPWHYSGERKTKHATKIITNEQGNTTSWIAEFFIPYALLKPLKNVPPGKGTEWRVNLYRIDYDEGSTSWTWQLYRRTFTITNVMAHLI